MVSFFWINVVSYLIPYLQWHERACLHLSSIAAQCGIHPRGLMAAIALSVVPTGTAQAELFGLTTSWGWEIRAKTVGLRSPCRTTERACCRIRRRMDTD